MNPQQATQLFNQEFQKRLKETPFPNELLPIRERLHFIKHHALQTESPASIGMPFNEFKIFLMKADGYTMFEAAQMFNMFERKTPRDLDNMPDYYAIQEAFHNAGNKWQELATPLREAAERKISIMANGAKGTNGKMRIISPQ